MTESANVFPTYIPAIQKKRNVKYFSFVKTYFTGCILAWNTFFTEASGGGVGTARLVPCPIRSAPVRCIMSRRVPQSAHQPHTSQKFRKSSDKDCHLTICHA